MPQHDIARSIGFKVRDARKAAGLTRRRLAELAAVSERYLNELEHGEANVSVGILARVAAAMHVDFASLMPSTSDAAPADRQDLVQLHRPLAELVAAMSPSEQQEAVGVLQHFLGERRKALKGIALLGLRGAGKSTIGMRLADRLGLPFVGVTREVEARAGMRLDDLFNLGGPEAYRALEVDTVRDIAARDTPVVLETAGGIVSNPEALEVVLGAFRTVWLKASAQEHLQRVIAQGDMRPVQGTPKALEHLKALLGAREPDYARADMVVDTTGRTVAACVEELSHRLGVVGGMPLAARSSATPDP